MVIKENGSLERMIYKRGRFIRKDGLLESMVMANFFLVIFS